MTHCLGVPNGYDPASAGVLLMIKGDAATDRVPVGPTLGGEQPSGAAMARPGRTGEFFAIERYTEVPVESRSAG